MCAILDSGKLPEIFEHNKSDYLPLIKWIEKSGKAITGGTQYATEVKATSKYVRFLLRLDQAGRLVKIPNQVIDDRVKLLKKIESSSSFDDPHLIALAIESGCKLICTSDKRSHKYIRDLRFYNKGQRPSIYYKVSHFKLLCDKNITGKCK